MKQLELKATTRSAAGNGPARRLRRQGKIPAVLYGPKTASLPLVVDVKELETALKEGSVAQSIFNLNIENGEKRSVKAMIRELQQHPVSGSLLHADFYEIDMSRKLRVMVPVVTTGVPAGVDRGGLLQIVRREVEVLCLPTDIPEAIEVDVSDLDIGDSLHVEDLVQTGKYEIPFESNFTVLTVVSPKVEEAAEEAEEAEELEEAAEGAETEDAGESAEE